MPADFHAADIRAAAFPPPRTVAVIGLSNRPGRPSHDVAGALLHWGYRVIPVNPQIDSALGLRAYPNLVAVPDQVDIAVLFRRSGHVADHLADIIAKGPTLLWLQDGVRHDAAARQARAAGILVVQDDCLARCIAGWQRDESAQERDLGA